MNHKNEVKNKTSLTRYAITSGDSNLLLPQDLSMEIIARSTVYFLPHAPHWCVGLLNVRGHLTPLVNLNDQHDEKSDQLRCKYVLVFHVGKQRIIALMLENIVQSISMSDCKKINPTMPMKTIFEPFLLPYINNVYQYKSEKLLFGFDCRRFLHALTKAV